MTDYPREQLEEVADLCRQAHDNILTYGWKQGSTAVGNEAAEGLCIGSAMAMARNDHSNSEKRYTETQWWNEERYAGCPSDLCDAGKVFRQYAQACGADVPDPEPEDLGWDDERTAIYWWNDEQDDETPVLDLLVNVEKAIREDLGEVA